jgi:LysR family glycine cleavage system transcriptional activator
VERILDDEMFPVCSPALAAGDPPLDQPEHLARQVLLHDEIPAVDGVQPGWRRWLEQVGAGQVTPAANRRFGQSNMVLQAAMAGLGVALGRSALVADDLAEGRLVRPFGPAVSSGFAYYIVCPHQTAESHKVAAFRAWLKDEAGRF